MAESSPMQMNEPVNLKVIRNQMISLGLAALSYRLLAFVTVGFVAGAFAWVMYDPVILRLVAASLFALFGGFIYHQAIKAGRVA